MKKITRLLLLIVPVFPVCYLLLHDILFGTSDSYYSMTLFVLFIISLFVIVYYFVHVWKNPKLSKDNKITWSLFLFLFSGITQVIYWFKYLRQIKTALS